jgi:hypothetical protein
MGHMTNAAAIAACDAVVDLVDAGGAGSLIIYAGSVPADADAALGGATVLATFTLPNPAFGGAADTTGEATANANAISDATATGSGTASFYRIRNNAGTAIWQGTVGTSASDLVISNTTIAVSDTVSITDLEFRVPEAITNYTPS